MKRSSCPFLGMSVDGVTVTWSLSHVPYVCQSCTMADFRAFSYPIQELPSAEG